MTITKEGALASFYTVNKAPIKHLKVYFSPKQAGSGDASPENVREISGWNEIKTYQNSNNLLSLNIPFQNPSTINSAATNVRIFQPYTYCVGASCTNYFATNVVTEYSINKDIITVKRLGSVYGVGIAIPLKPGQYHISAISDGYIHIAYYAENGVYITYDSFNNSNKSFTVPSNCVMTVLIFVAADSTGTNASTFSNIMLNKGNTALSYEPYRGTVQAIKFGPLTKNLFNPNCDMWQHNTYSISGDQITQVKSDNRGWTDNTNFKSMYLSAGTYTIMCSDNGTFNIATSTNEFNPSIRLTSGGGSFTLTNDCNVKIKHSASSYPTTFTIQLEKGDSVTSYEKYNDTIYGGYIDLITGELVQTFSVEEPNDNIFYFSSNYCYQWGHAKCNTDAYENQIYKNAISSHWKITSYANADFMKLNQNGAFWIGKNIFDAAGIDFTNAGIQSYIAQQKSNGTPLQAGGPLITPITYQLTPAQLQTFIGQNNIWSNADRIEIEYDLAESNDELYRRRNIILQGAPHLETATGDIVNFNTDMIAPIKDAKIYFNPVQEGEGDPSPENVRSITGWTGLDINQTGKNLINLSTISKQNNSSNIDTTITDNTVTITAKKANGSGVLLQQTFYWDIPQALRGKAVYFGVGSVTLTTNNENHKATIVCEFKDKDNKFITDPTVVSWTNGSSNNTIVRKTTIPENAAKLEMYFRIAQNASTYGIIIGDTVTYHNFYIRYPTEPYGNYEEYNGNIIPITFPAIGKNLLDITRTEKINPGVSTSTITISNGVISIDAVASSARSYIMFSQEFSAGIYTIQAKNSGAIGVPKLLVNIEFNDSSYNSYYNAYMRQLSSEGKFTFTLTQTAKIGIVLPNETNESGNPGTLYDIQLEQGTTATTYEPYTNTVYGGYLDLINDKLISNWKTVTVNSTNTTIKDGGYYGKFFRTVATNAPAALEYRRQMLGTHSLYRWWSGSEVQGSYHYTASDGVIYWQVPDCATEEGRTAILSAGVQFVYPIETPIEYTLTPQTLKTLKGTNNIWSNANGPVSITYWTH